MKENKYKLSEYGKTYILGLVEEQMAEAMERKDESEGGLNITGYLTRPLVEELMVEA